MAPEVDAGGGGIDAPAALEDGLLLFPFSFVAGADRVRVGPASGWTDDADDELGCSSGEAG